MTIVVGYIASDEGRAAIRLAANEALLRGSRLIIVASRTIDEPNPLNAREIVTYDDKVDRARAEAEQELASVQERLDEAGVAYELRTLVSDEEPSDHLAAVAGEENADFIVIGLRRRSAVGKLLLGSNAQRILIGAPCPVIAVHATPPN